MIGLARSSCDHFLFSGQAALSASVMDQIQNEFSVDVRTSRQGLEFRERAAIDRSVEHLQVRLVGESEQPLTFEIGFHYDADTLRRRARTAPDEFRSGAVLLEVLAGLSAEVEFECSASFEYRLTAAQRLFPVRLGTGDQEGRAFDEIRGLTAVKLEDGEVFYTVALESFDLETLSAYVTFKQTASFSATLPARLLQRAVSIGSRFSE